MAYDSLPCPSCGASLEPDRVCLACLFDETLGAADSQFGQRAESSFGDFAPSTAGMFGKYILRRRLGEGGMGVIWEAEDTTLQRVVALKMIRGFAFSSDSERQRFKSEASTVAQLDHPNIVPIYEVGTIEDQPLLHHEAAAGRHAIDTAERQRHGGRRRGGGHGKTRSGHPPCARAWRASPRPETGQCPSR